MGEDLSRDVSSLRAVLESEDEEERRLGIVRFTHKFLYFHTELYKQHHSLV